MDKVELQVAYSDAIKEMVPKDFVPFEDSLNIYQYVRKYQLPAWDFFSSIEKHYANNSYSYELLRISDSVIRYTEFYNSAAIRTIDFLETDIAWKILQLADNKILSVEVLCQNLDCNNEIVDKEIQKLRDVGLLFVGKQSKECVSIIHTLNIL